MIESVNRRLDPNCGFCLSAMQRWAIANNRSSKRALRNAENVFWTGSRHSGRRSPVKFPEVDLWLQRCSAD
jgi:hypothetical protein